MGTPFLKYTYLNDTVSGGQFTDILFLVERPIRKPLDFIKKNLTEEKVRTRMNPTFDNIDIQIITYRQFVATAFVQEYSNITNFQKAIEVIYNDRKIKVSNITDERIDNTTNYKVTIEFHELESVVNNLEMRQALANFGGKGLSFVYIPVKDDPSVSTIHFYTLVTPRLVTEIKDETKEKKGSGQQLKSSQTVLYKFDLMFFLNETDSLQFDKYVNKSYFYDNGILKIPILYLGDFENILTEVNAAKPYSYSYNTGSIPYDGFRKFPSVTQVEVERIQDNELIGVQKRKLTLTYYSEVFNFFA